MASSITIPFGEKFIGLATPAKVSMKFNETTKQLTVVTEVTFQLKDNQHKFLESGNEVPVKTGMVNFSLGTDLRDDLPEINIIAKDNKKFFLESRIKINGEKRDHSI